MISSRRHFLQRCSTAVAVQALVPPVLRVNLSRSFSGGFIPKTVTAPMDPDIVKQLALHGVDVGNTAGASYVDVRITRTLTQGIIPGGVDGFHDRYAVGVRCLVNGAWGFAANAFLSREEVARTTQSAITQAQANSSGRGTPIEIPQVPAVTGDWTMPGLDPFAVSIEEKIDQGIAFDSSLGVPVPLQPGLSEWGRQERAVATSDGTYVTQTTFRVRGGGIAIAREVMKEPRWFWGSPFHGLSMAGRGWDQLVDAHLTEQFPQRIEESRELWYLPIKPVEVGRYTVVMDAETMASLVGETIGKATELDRVLGYEANAGGTSFLGPDPLAKLGNFRVGSSALTVTANRSMPYGCATVQWDDEGIRPVETTLVSQGILTDYQTTRRLMTELAPYNKKIGRTGVSYGNAAAPSAMDFTMLHRPNLVLAPGKEDLTIMDLIRTVKRGLAVFRGNVDTDFQAKTGLGLGAVVREIVNGKLGDRIQSSGVLFTTTELWNSLTALGGRRSVETYGFEQTKGQPEQTMAYSVQAVPGLFVNVTVIDPTRKA